MNRRPEPDTHDHTAYHWLTQHQHALTYALDDLLDTEAGLREILLHSHHDTATDNLATVLDTEAGLAAIVPAPQFPPTDTHDTPYRPTDTAQLLHTLSPADRMALRNNPDVKAASDALSRDRDFYRGLVRSRDFVRDRAAVLARTLASTVTRDLDVIRARALAVALDRDLSLVYVLARSRDLDRDLDHDLDRRIDLTRNLAHALGFSRDLERLLGRVRDRSLARDLAHSYARARDLAHAVSICRDLDFYPDFEVTRARTGIVEIHTAEVGRAIGLALHQDPLVLDKDSPHALLNDFTTTDLSTADLTGIDLSGVHWSEHTTQWPPVVDVETLKAHSDEISAGTGIWIVRSGTATIRDLVER